MSIQCERALCVELVTDSGFLGREWRDNSYSKVSLIFTMSFLSIFALFSNHLVAMLVSRAYPPLIGIYSYADISFDSVKPHG